MRCHYENIKGVGKVFIPGCWGGALSGDMTGCTCRLSEQETQSFDAYERKEFNNEVKRLKTKIKNLEEENEYCRNLFEKNEIEYDFKKLKL